jgi:alkylation response protein AidB-like acyl-CoA dehydrogenase
MFSLSPDLAQFQSKVRTFAQNHIAPCAATIDQTAEYPRDLHRLLVEQGYMRMVATPEPSPQRFLLRALLIEEIAYASAAVSMIPMVNELGCTPLQLFGSAAQKQRWLGGVADGSLFASYGLTEPDAGSDVAALASEASADGDHFIINGQKSWICNVQHPGFCIVFATIDPSDKRRGLTAFIVPTDSDGFDILNAEPTLGLRGSPTYNFKLHHVRVARENVLGQPGDGFRIAMMTLSHTRPAVAAQALGIARAARDAALSYARERKSMGRALIEHQAIGFMLADMEMKIRAARHLVYEANMLLGETLGGDAIVTASAKCFAADTAMQVSTDAVQILGGNGYSKNFPVERFFRDAKVTQIYEGTNQIQRMVIARKMALAPNADERE